MKFRATRIEELAQTGSRRAKEAKRVISKLDMYLSATQLGITFASLGLGWIGEPAVARLIEPLFRDAGIGSEAAIHGVSLAIAFAIISFAHIVLGELAPKSLAIRQPESTALWTAIPLHLFYWVMYPAIKALQATANLVLKVFGLEPADGVESAHTEEELRMIVSASHAHGVLNSTERALLEAAIGFSERLVREIMIPRPDMVCLYLDRPLEQNLAIVRENQHTRYPLAIDEPDKIVGMIHGKDLLEYVGSHGANAPALDLKKLKRPVLFIPEVASIDMLLKVFQRGRSHLAIVVDEYGGVAGLVTLEDVLEELVGPIRDEFDVEEPGIVTRPGGEAIVEASLPLAEVAERFRFEPDEPHHVATIGGYVLQHLGRLPKVGESVQIDKYRVEVAQMEGLRVTRLRFVPVREGPGRTAAAGDGVGASTSASTEPGR